MITKSLSLSDAVDEGIEIITYGIGNRSKSLVAKVIVRLDASANADNKAMAATIYKMTTYLPSMG